MRILRPCSMSINSDFFPTSKAVPSRCSIEGSALMSFTGDLPLRHSLTLSSASMISMPELANFCHAIEAGGSQSGRSVPLLSIGRSSKRTKCKKSNETIFMACPPFDDIKAGNIISKKVLLIAAVRLHPATVYPTIFYACHVTMPHESH